MKQEENPDLMKVMQSIFFIDNVFIVELKELFRYYLLISYETKTGEMGEWLKPQVC